MIKKVLKYNVLEVISIFETCRILPDRFSQLRESRYAGYCRIAKNELHISLDFKPNSNITITGFCRIT